MKYSLTIKIWIILLLALHRFTGSHCTGISSIFMARFVTSLEDPLQNCHITKCIREGFGTATLRNDNRITSYMYKSQEKFPGTKVSPSGLESLSKFKQQPKLVQEAPLNNSIKRRWPWDMIKVTEAESLMAIEWYDMAVEIEEGGSYALKLNYISQSNETESLPESKLEEINLNKNKKLNSAQIQKANRSRSLSYECWLSSSAKTDIPQERYLFIVQFSNS